MTGLRLFITGTDTDIGKTVVATVLVRALNADYWKPVQSGTNSAEGTDDTQTVAHLAGLTQDRCHRPSYSFKAPLSPHDAAAREGVEIDLNTIRPPDTDRPLIAEGAGGVLVPLSPGPDAPGAPVYIADLAARLGYPTILVARNSLGTINHTLMSLEALRARAVPILGVILNEGDMTSNGMAIAQFGRTRLLYQMPHLTALDPSGVDQVAGDLRQKLEAMI